MDLASKLQTIARGQKIVDSLPKFHFDGENMISDPTGDFPATAAGANAGFIDNSMLVSGTIPPLVRTFETGAIRNLDTTKLDYEGFYSPQVMEAYATYMNFNRDLIDGTRRDSDNWQKGIPMAQYMKSGYRHFMEWWSWQRDYKAHIKEGIVWALCGLLFNVQGYLHEYLKANPDALAQALADNTAARDALWAAKK